PARRRRSARHDGLERRIAQVRRQLGLTQEAFARRIGVSRNAVGRYEAGTLALRATTLDRIADAGRVSTDWLLRGDRPSVTTVPGRDPAWTAAVTLLRRLWTCSSPARCGWRPGGATLDRAEAGALRTSPPASRRSFALHPPIG